MSMFGLFPFFTSLNYRLVMAFELTWSQCLAHKEHLQTNSVLYPGKIQRKFNVIN